MNKMKCRPAQLWQFPGKPAWQKEPVQIKLPDRGAHIWICDLQNSIMTPMHISPEELRRARDMIPRTKRTEFLMSRHWLRTLLAKYVHYSVPSQIRIEISPSQKPFMPKHMHLHFNLSHSYQLLAIAIANRPVGIDVEKIRPVPDWPVLANGILHEKTLLQISSINIENQSQLFLKAFTAREAFIKSLDNAIIPHPFLLKNFLPESIPRSHQIIALPEIDGYVGNLCCNISDT